RARLEYLGIPNLADPAWRSGQQMVDQGTDLLRRDLRSTSDQDGRPCDHALAAAGHAEQGLVLQAQAQVAGELVDGLRLVAGGLEIGDELEVGHDEVVGGR